MTGRKVSEMAAEMPEKGVVLLGFWSSMFGNRPRIALEEKKVEYEYREEDLGNKSAALLRLNPAYKKIPVLVHDGRPVCESLVIVEYVDEVWRGGGATGRLLPTDPLARAHARFWAAFIDDKVFGEGNKLWIVKGGEPQNARKQFLETMKLLEAELGEKKYFGGEEFGFLDIALVTYSPWFHTYQQYGGFRMEEELPKLMAWVERCKERESVSKVLPHRLEIYEHSGFLRKRYGIE